MLLRASADIIWITEKRLSKKFRIAVIELRLAWRSLRSHRGEVWQVRYTNATYERLELSVGEMTRYGRISEVQKIVIAGCGTGISTNRPFGPISKSPCLRRSCGSAGLKTFRLVRRRGAENMWYASRLAWWTYGRLGTCSIIAGPSVHRFLYFSSICRCTLLMIFMRGTKKSMDNARRSLVQILPSVISVVGVGHTEASCPSGGRSASPTFCRPGIERLLIGAENAPENPACLTCRSTVSHTQSTRQSEIRALRRSEFPVRQSAKYRLSM